ncbi:hypothetical protein SAMN05192539_1007225 [Paraburkholderia diazotrophica]|uniref:Uncharacterized protein n=1 Tax=Paraburkholderia diazotrophica TaxID=667676 RepID=A0A1H6X3A8_9BURK|nr:hypothetical protein SAMN05192539_1007225 [Paraburkholderia diazotrophica]
MTMRELDRYRQIQKVADGMPEPQPRRWTSRCVRSSGQLTIIAITTPGGVIHHQSTRISDSGIPASTSSQVLHL